MGRCIVRRAFLASTLLGALGCSSSSDTPPSGTSGADKAQLRFKNTTGTSWQAHIAAGKSQVTGFAYKITVGSIPLSVSFDLSNLDDGQATDYKAVDAATIRDQNVLHIWSYNYNKGGASYVGGSETQQLYGLLGIDLTLAANKHYTVELGSSASTLVEDP